ncbi:TetR/AcrR family transcriptional regulator [Tropicibacter sp. R16_0]|uniref:TetR/AcrR family transcriptional regulator n=1 Tax=Tropicibacter sp. R16_0 TaxID=2821102 RepID=UPI001ADCB1B6|nr:TetR/AcrR family transcriptional regulator [Tropicibacter sp. R16_0]MBO9450774.1 TetR/AcrR family transcriptional regulator [Tropicibacter sp. R16_0]
MTDTASPKISLQDQRSQAMRTKICRAAIDCLDRLGYAETTFAKIQAKANVSRGAITHHFPTKQALVAATAMQLLSNAQGPVERGDSLDVLPVYDLIMTSWTRIVNSSGGRAIVEILVACRTDAELYQLLEDSLLDWDQSNLALIAQSYTSVSGEREDTELLWSIARNFLRGLLLHEKFVSSPEYLTRMMDRFARMMESQLSVRPTPDQETQQ